MDGPPVVAPTFHLAQRDAVVWLRTLASESVDLVVTDPPYESLEKHRAIGTTTRLKHSKASSNDWFSIFPNDRFPELFAEVYRVLRRNTHFYLFCDPETMFVAKPLAEVAGFKFWKPLIWDKCLGPDTLVWTERGVVRIADVEVGDRVAIPEGGTTEVRAKRRTRREALRMSLSDGTKLVASREHIFVLPDARQVEAGTLMVGQALLTRPIRRRAIDPVTQLYTTALVQEARPIRIDAIDAIGERDLIDISIEDRDELFLLANGVVTHNCKIGMGYHYRARYECILFFEKGKRKLANLGIADILEAPRISGGYPAEKPPAVSEVLIRQSTEPGQLVIDPFMGSGSVGVAAVTHGRVFAGNDLCKEAVDITRGRLREAGAGEVRGLGTPGGGSGESDQSARANGPIRCAR
ncbi:MAG TPA: DNA methyltransferase [Kofleriaceae bacterium]|jgi:DNA modification methylase|nr:DNA methyltransferase [Kofleriaceae bacterium]